MASSSDALYQTTKEAISETAFYGVLWFGIGLCTLAFILRCYIRHAYFRRLLADDILMLVALLNLIAIAVIQQLYLSDIYLMIHVQNGLATPGADFLDRMTAGLRADGVCLILDTIGIYLIKLNFMLFFYKIGNQITQYLVFWWISLVLIMGCGIAALGVIPYSCMFGDIMHIIAECSTASSVAYIYTVYKAAVILDVLSDAIIIAFPVVILWNAGITLRQKLVLSAIFCLVGFTIAVTIIRGSIFGGLYRSLDDIDHKVLDTAWALFWYYIEYIVSFIVACLVSFRSLWVRKKQQQEDSARKQIRDMTPQTSSHASPARSRLRRVHDSLLDTFNDAEEPRTVNERHSFDAPADFSRAGDPWSTSSKADVGWKVQTETDSESGRSWGSANRADEQQV